MSAMIVRLNASQANRMANQVINSNRAIDSVYTQIRQSALRGSHKCAWFGAGYTQSEIDRVMELLLHDGYKIEYDPGWRELKISWRIE